MAILVHHDQDGANGGSGGSGARGGNTTSRNSKNRTRTSSSGTSSVNDKGSGNAPMKVVWTLLVFFVGRQSTHFNVFRSSSSSAVSLQRAMAGYFVDYGGEQSSSPSSSSTVPGGASSGAGAAIAAGESSAKPDLQPQPQRHPESEPVEYSLALKESYGLLDRTTNDDWRKLKQQTNAKSWYFDQDDPLKPDINNTTEWNAFNMIPNFDCPLVEQMGNPARGESKYVCNPQRLTAPPPSEESNNKNSTTTTTNCLIYSFGCAGDFQFEDSLVQRIQNPPKGCEIHVFDPASAFERPDDIVNKNIHYHAWGLRSSYDEESKSVVWPKGRKGGFKTFQETLDELGHAGRTIDILKIDCEGCEWSTVEDWIHLGIRQILIETHGVPSPDGTPKARWYQKPLHIHNEYYRFYQEEGYALFHKEINGLALELCFIKLHPDFWKSSGGGGNVLSSGQQQRRLLNESKQDGSDGGSAVASSGAVAVNPQLPGSTASVPAIDMTTTTISPEEYNYDDDIKLLIELTTRGNTSLVCPPHLRAYHNRIVPSSTITEGKQKQKIPKIIHITEKSRCVNPDMYHALKVWEQHFPTWNIFFHDDEAVDLLLNMEVWDTELAPHFHEILNCVSNGAMKIDIWRLIVTWRFGGMYSDNDGLPSKRFHDEILHKDTTFFTLSDGWDRPSQWLFASTPKHPVLTNTMQILPRYVLDMPDIAYPKVVFVTGPQMLFNGYRNIFGNATKLELPSPVDREDDNANIQNNYLMISPPSQEYGGNLIVQRYFKRDKPQEMFMNDTYWSDEVPCPRECNNRTLISRKERNSIDAERLHWLQAKGSKSGLPSVSCRQHLTNLGHNYSVISSAY